MVQTEEQLAGERWLLAPGPAAPAGRDASRAGHGVSVLLPAATGAGRAGGISPDPALASNLKEITMTRSSAAAPAPADVYTRVTNHIIADLENGVRPWLKPWSADNMAGPIKRPLHSNGQPDNGINVLML